MDFLGFLSALVKTNLRSSLALRGAFWLQLIFMAVNNLVFFVVWWIFFERFDDIAGWSLKEVEAMYGITAASFGLAYIFGGGIRDLAQKIIDGGLDAYLVQPKGVLLKLVMSHSRASGWGDVIAGFILLGMSGYLTSAQGILVPFFLVTSAFVFIGAGIVAHSLAFWLGPVNHLSRQLFEFLITFSVYPQTIFPMAFKLLLFTVIPAGFISYLPVEVLREFDWTNLGITMGGAILYFAFACWVFYRGLRRYESGNRVST